MKIKNIQIKNFRSFKNCEVEFDNFTSLVGANGSGKSTVLYALNIFFRESEGSNTNVINLDKEDFYQRNTQEAIEITVTFDDLSDEALNVFANYARQGVLIITAKAVFDENSNIATVQQYGQRLAMDEFKNFFKLWGDGASAAELKSEYELIRQTFSDLPPVGTKDGNRDALRSYENANPDKCVLIPSEDQFYGVTKGSNRLAKFIQWVYLPAVKDATKENIEGKNTSLGKILARTVRAKVKFTDEVEKLRQETLEKYRNLVESQQGALDEISQSLSEKLGEWAHPEATARLTWHEDAKKAVQVEEPIARLLTGDGVFEGDLARFGHGLQRSYLLALLQELSHSDDSDAPKLILGCEEPELYQHPPQARHLSNVLRSLSEHNSQVIVSTHSPYFVTGKHFESVRLVRRNPNDKCSNILSIRSERISKRKSEITEKEEASYDAQIAFLHQALQPNLNEIFFTPKLILVEGLEDVAYITSWMILTERWNEYRRRGCHIVPVGGKGYLINPLIIAQELEIPTFVVFDADGNISNADQRPKHEKDNKALLHLLDGDISKVFPEEVIWGKNYAVWPKNLGDTFKSETNGNRIWDRTYSEVCKNLGEIEGDRAKNTIHIGNHLALLKSQNVDIPSLTKLCEAILNF